MGIPIWAVKKRVAQIGAKVVYSVQIDCADWRAAEQMADKLAIRAHVETVKNQHAVSAEEYVDLFTNPSLWEAIIDEINNQEL